MIIVTGTVRFGEGEIERLRPALERNIAATRAEQGCESYHYARDLLDPDLLHVSERWHDEAAVDGHMGAPHMAELMESLGTARIEGMSIKAWRAEPWKTLLGE
jgi:quinol monooxygenase YgiN